MSFSSIDVQRCLRRGDVKKLDSLVESGLDIHETSKDDDWNLLHRALVSVNRKTSPEIVNYLIDKGVNVNARDIRLWTPLHFAARQKNVGAMNALLGGGAEVDPVNDEGVTPLRLTLMSRPLEKAATELLLMAGADPQHELRGNSVREYAETVVHGDDADILELFRQADSA